MESLARATMCAGRVWLETRGHPGAARLEAGLDGAWPAIQPAAATARFAITPMRWAR